MAKTVAKKPRQQAPATISYKLFAEACDVSPGYIGRLVKEGVIPFQGHGQIPVIEGFGSSPEAAANSTAANARAAEINMRVAREERKLIPIDEAIDILSVFLGGVRSEVAPLDGDARPRIASQDQGEV
jgi:hypothetical protein